ncbi:S-layer homology domain-containing protein [Alteribacillus iranensis]|uniref:S-layer homology domain-containing protein n=1 Tax=Alteribacillus iranensis TaxID=930128 RepID=A0A1I2EH45_9BACI|nr:S-layer homology domain-containing protein [Alteribacillus iranensis]SFE92394.1 S-layer homology domain-containing protein [Alteribacillus iranensis]
MKSKNAGFLLSVMLFIVIVAGCSQASADPSEEAASAEWTEEKLGETEEDLDAVSERVDDLAQDIRVLSGVPEFSEEPVFPDVNDDYFAFEEIQFLSGQRIISGFPDGHFRPGETITRSQTAKMLRAALDLDAPEDYQIKATDVSDNHHAYRSLAALEYHGIMTGNDGRLMPSAGLKRSQMAALLVRAYELPEADKQHTFTDIDEDYPNFEEINIIADQGITTETGKAFRPNETTTRAQFSLFMSRAIHDYFRP